MIHDLNGSDISLCILKDAYFVLDQFSIIRQGRKSIKEFIIDLRIRIIIDSEAHIFDWRNPLLGKASFTLSEGSPIVEV